MPDLLQPGLDHTSTFKDEDVPDQPERLAERAAVFVSNVYGSWPMFFGYFAVLITWALVNILHLPYLHHFDEWPFPFMNYMLSVDAAVTPIFILMAQNAQAKRADALLELVAQSAMRTEAQMESIEVAFSAILANQEKQLAQQRAILSLLAVPKS